MFMTEFCKQHPEKLLVAVFQCRCNGVFELLAAVLYQLTAGRQFHALNFFARGALYRLQHTLFTWGNKQDRLTAAAGTARAADTMHIGFVVVRNIVVHNVADTFNIQTAGGNIGGYHNIQLTVLQLLDRADT